MELVVDGLPDEPFLRAWEAIRKRIPAVNDIPNLKIYAVSEGEELELPLTDLPLDVAFSFQKMLEGADTSFFYSDENQNLVVIKVSREIEFVLTDNTALRGLLAHELLHALQKYRGLDNDLKRCYSLVLNEMEPLLGELEYNKKSLQEVINEIGITSILVLKDLYVDDELVRKGFTKEILAYYSRLFMVKKSCPLVKFRKIIEGRKIKEKEFPSVIDALTFELELLPTWLPFEKTHSNVAQELKAHIETCYEADLGWIAKDFHELIVLYMTEFANTCKFHRDYYRLILDRLYAMLAGIDNFSLHMREAINTLQTKKMDPENKFILSSLIKALYLHMKDSKDKTAAEEKKELEDWLREHSGKREFEEFMGSKISKTELLKVPILWSIRKARMDYAESPRSDFIDIAYDCTEAGAEVTKEKLFHEASVVLTQLNVFSPYKLVGDLLKLEFLFEKDVFGKAPQPRVAERLMKELRKRAILPDNHSVPPAKDIINLTFRMGTEDPGQIALSYVSILKLSLKDSDLIESTLLAMGYKLDFIHLVNKEIARLT